MKKKTVIIALALALVLALAGCTDKKVSVVDNGSGDESIKSAIGQDELTADDNSGNSMTVKGETSLESLPESSESTLLPESGMMP